ncbi:LysR family transcriptional regulator ArgP [Pseudoalteromonas carrageenovora]|uniref:LysR family transcriptional regulator, chromosome initiation inhibitor n=2 Tax=Pseudoalteromonas carrageenovora IAM 12662 TaxID=1314868 RepID=A0ABR9EWN5_PSEVC|nr:LysR family transcriptional regulator ArgP [Pseudoalteromonas carrageenovora]MBE0384301.1 LysR family transcriptional regulator, chromosome initiation inhibitor [Pseudoalteromonas carrageenovora IAM 12662]
MNIFIVICVKLMIDYQLLNALSAVISEGGFEKASKKLFITQSAVSRRIHQLEAKLGEPVLIRTQPPSPTVLGKRLLNHLQQVLQLEVALNVGALNEHTDLNTPLSVRLAANADSLATWLPEALAVLDSELTCKLRFEVISEDQSVAHKRMRDGEVMVCISSSPEPVNGGLVSPLGAIRYKAIASPEFIKQHKINDLSQLAHLPCLVYSDLDKLQHQFLNDINGSTPLFTHIYPSSEGFKQAMIAGLGYGLLPTLQLGDSLTKGELVDLFPEYYIDTPLYWHYWQTESPQLKTLRKFALQVAGKRLERINP